MNLLPNRMVIDIKPSATIRTAWISSLSHSSSALKSSRDRAVGGRVGLRSCCLGDDLPVRDASLSSVGRKQLIARSRKCLPPRRRVIAKFRTAISSQAPKAKDHTSSSPRACGGDRRWSTSQVEKKIAHGKTSVTAPAGCCAKLSVRRTSNRSSPNTPAATNADLSKMPPGRKWSFSTDPRPIAVRQSGTSERAAAAVWSSLAEAKSTTRYQR